MKNTPTDDKITTTDNVVNHLFETNSAGSIIALKLNHQIASSLLPFTHVKSLNNDQRIAIGKEGKNMTKVLALTFKEQQIKVRVSSKHLHRQYVETFEWRMSRLVKKHDHLKVLKVVPKNGTEEVDDSPETKPVKAIPKKGKAKSEDLPETKLAKLAASEFVQLIQRHKGEPTVAIGGGQTLRVMSLYVDLREVRPFKSVPLNLVMRVPEDKVFDSSAVAMSIYRLASKGSSAHIISIPPTPRKDIIKAAEWHSMLFDLNEEIQSAFHASLDPDIVFVGTGNFYEGSQTVSKLMSHLGIDYDFLNDCDPKPVGDLNFCLFDADGVDITPQVLKKITSLHHGNEGIKTYFPNEKYCHPFFVGLNIKRMQDLVEAGKTVVVVAGGLKGTKARALHALLKAKVMNGLITDSDTLSALLEM